MRILWIPHTGWHIPQRAHLFCKALSQRHEVHVTDWVADFSGIRDIFSKRYLRNFTYRYRMDGNIHVHGIPRISPALYSKTLREINQKIYLHYVQSIVDQYKIDVVVGTFVSPPPRAPRLILDVFDDNPAYWREFKANESYAAEIEQMELKWAKKSDAIVVVSSVLKEKLAKKLDERFRKKIHIIPNGVNLYRFSMANRTLVRSQLKLTGRKVVGFISGFGEFSGLLRYMEAIRFINDENLYHLIVGDGPLLKDARVFTEKWKLRNVKFTGWVDSNKVPNYFAALDVGVIPFDLSDFTHSAFPIKLLEYLACNIPVVSTPLEEIRRLDFPGVLLSGSDSKAFAEGIRQALKMTNIPKADLSRYDVSHLIEQYERLMEGDI